MADKKNSIKRQKEFTNCNHIWLIKKGERDSKKCLKCGLTDEVFYDETLEECKLMQKFILEHTRTLIKGKKIEYDYEYSFVRTIYNIIKDKRPDIDDEKMKKYIEISLDKINNKKMKEKKYEKCIKRIEQYNK